MNGGAPKHISISYTFHRLIYVDADVNADPFPLGDQGWWQSNEAWLQAEIGLYIMMIVIEQ